MELITVQAATITNRAVLWERTPGGDVWITGDGRAYTVPLTPAVADAIDRGVLVVVEPAPRPVSDPVPNIEMFSRRRRSK